MRGKRQAYWFFVGLVLVVSSWLHAPTAYAALSDVSENHSFYSSIVNLEERGVIKGFPDGTFRPNEPVTRGQTAALLTRLLNINMEQVTNPQFSDIAQTHPNYKAIATLANLGVITGHTDGTFRAGDFVQRNHLAIMLTRAFMLTPAQATLPFTDVSAYHAPFVATLYANGITTGRTPTTFAGNQFVTRGQMAEFLVRTERVANVKSQELVALGDNFETGGEGHWGEKNREFLEKTATGYYTVEWDWTDVHVTTYDAAFKQTSSMILPKELPVFGTFYRSKEGNFITYGQHNPNNENIEVIRIVKYDEQFNRIGHISVYGDESDVSIPFHASTGGRMAEENGHIVYHTSKLKYSQHQSNLTIEFNARDMTLKPVERLPFHYVSHSFNQFVLFDQGAPVYLDHGDASPRALVVQAQNPFAPNFNDLHVQLFDEPTYLQEFFNIRGGYGNNVTGVTVGSFEKSKAHYLVSFSSIDQTRFDEFSEDKTNKRALYVYAIPDQVQDEETSTIKRMELANFIETDSIASAPILLKVSDTHFIALWQEHRDDFEYRKTTYVHLDHEGKVISDTYELKNAWLSDVKPVLTGNVLTWYTIGNGKKVFYEVALEGDFSR